VESYPALFFAAMVSFLKYLISACTFLLLPASGLLNAAPQGFMEGRLKIISLKEVELAEGNPPKFSAGNYVEYPLIILSQDRKQEIASVTADEDGNYRIALPPGNYVLDVQDRRRKHVRATPQQFRVVSNQTVHVDMDLDTGIR
jgi:hypothetical protein